MHNLATLNICFLAGTLEHGGAERQLFYILRALCRSGAAPRVLCFDRGEFWEAAIRSLGIPVTWVGQRNSRLARLFRVWRELRQDPPDLFQSQHFFANAYVGLSAGLLGLGGIGALRSDAEADLRQNGRLGGWLNLHLPGLIAANSRLAIQQAVARGVPPTRLYFLPNVVDTEHFRPATGDAERPLTLLTVGRLVRTKRFDRFISILARLRKVVPSDVRGVIVGPPADRGLREELEAQASHLGLTHDNLRFAGGVTDMAPLYRQSDVCVLTSDFEGTPNVLLEAMASGLPVVATNVGGVPAVVQNGNSGFVRERDDLEGLVSALAELAKDAALRTRMGRQARHYIEHEHSLEQLPTWLGRLYALANPPRRQSRPAIVRSSAA